MSEAKKVRPGRKSSSPKKVPSKSTRGSGKGRSRTEPPSSVVLVRDDENELVRLVFDTPNKSVNVLNEETLLALEAILERLMGEEGDDTKALVVESAKPNMFIAGADIAEIRDLEGPSEAEAKSSRGQGILSMLSGMPFPTVAVIDGACLGGGLELALWCDFRVATEAPKTKIGLPEVNLGVVPGFGGCHQLPKIVGFQKAIELIAGAKIVGGRQAQKIGLADKTFYPEYLSMFLPRFLEGVKSIPAKELQQRRTRVRTNNVLERSAWGRRFVARSAEKQVAKKTKNNYPAPLEAVRAVKKMYGLRLARALQVEAKAFGSLAATPTSRNLIQLFYTTEALKKETGLVGAKASSVSFVKTFERVGVVGAGFMGGGIAYLAAKSGINTLMKDIAAEAIGQGYSSARQLHDYKLRRRQISKREVELNMQRIHGVLDYGGFGELEVVVEAVVENLEVKKKVFAELEANTSDKTILASNTSSLSVGEMAKGLRHPGRFAGLHFFSPVNRMPLVEVVAGGKTSPSTLASLVAFSKAIGKTPIVVKDCPGFLVNRLLFPYLNEAFRLALEGSSISFLEKSAVHYGMPLGPFALLDEVGVDVAAKVAGILHSGYGERMQPDELLQQLAEGKMFLGRKTGRGFYDYSAKKKTLNKAVLALLSERRRREERPTKGTAAYEEVAMRFFLSMANEAAKCIEEGIVKNAPILDMAMVMGVGFPAFRGGPLRWLDSIGLSTALKKLEQCHEQHGERYRPAALLVDMAKTKKTFYGATD